MKEKITSEQAFEELLLNLKHQNIKPVNYIGYEFDKGEYVFALVIPNTFRKK